MYWQKILTKDTSDKGNILPNIYKKPLKLKKEETI